MKVKLTVKGKKFEADLQKPRDISIPLKEQEEAVNCFFSPPFETSPVIAGDFVGSTRQGGPLNFLNVRLNPHGNGTHTECVGHIAKETYTINRSLKQFHFLSKLVTVIPTKEANGDRVIYPEHFKDILTEEDEIEALIIRTIPNDFRKLTMNYSGTNPPYFHHSTISFFVKSGIEHLLVDLPSIDKEEDGGKLLGHKAFWQYPENIRENCTITELIYAPDLIKDDFYLLGIHIASFEIDVSPSKPILYDLVEI